VCSYRQHDRDSQDDRDSQYNRELWAKIATRRKEISENRGRQDKIDA
jgi:hypothetical protein